MEVIKTLEDLFNPIPPIAQGAMAQVPDIENLLTDQQHWTLDGYLNAKAEYLDVQIPIVDYPVTSASGNEVRNYLIVFLEQLTLTSNSTISDNLGERKSGWIGGVHGH